MDGTEVLPARVEVLPPASPQAILALAVEKGADPAVISLEVLLCR